MDGSATFKIVESTIAINVPERTVIRACHARRDGVSLSSSIIGLDMASILAISWGGSSAIRKGGPASMPIHPPLNSLCNDFPF